MNEQKRQNEIEKRVYLRKESHKHRGDRDKSAFASDSNEWLFISSKFINTIQSTGGGRTLVGIISVVNQESHIENRQGASVTGSLFARKTFHDCCWTVFSGRFCDDAEIRLDD